MIGNGNTERGKLTFPCQFTFKIIGQANQAFEGEVLKILHQHFPQLSENAIRYAVSKNANYLAYTVTVQAESQEQLDATYQALSDSPLVLFAL
ncbi:MAG: hypothetical protein BGO43_03895 [Gammaproteobacteria bacterium 39-13]|nr:DUF493 domain-containing protein [Gammaproteobacteria bacterium]OJV96015.1 MAG: hypothetical protein BGO43_03895 [Gammaproteobacteria bacterium 39-13]